MGKHIEFELTGTTTTRRKNKAGAKETVQIYKYVDQFKDAVLTVKGTFAATNLGLPSDSYQPTEENTIDRLGLWASVDGFVQLSFSLSFCLGSRASILRSVTNREAVGSNPTRGIRILPLTNDGPRTMDYLEGLDRRCGLQFFAWVVQGVRHHSSEYGESDAGENTRLFLEAVGSRPTPGTTLKDILVGVAG